MKISEYEQTVSLAGYFGVCSTGSDTKKFPLLKSGFPFVIAQSAAAIALTGTVAETLMASVLIPGGTIGANGRLRIAAVWSNTNNANNKTRAIRFGAASGVAGTLYSSITVTTQVSHYNEHHICNRNSQSSQIGVVPVSATGGPGAFNSAPVTSTVATSSDSYLCFTGTLASAGDTITLESYLVEVMYKE